MYERFEVYNATLTPMSIINYPHKLCNKFKIGNVSIFIFFVKMYVRMNVTYK